MSRNPPPHVFRVGLTGGIATGKSEVGRVFREEGAFVLDADALGHVLTEPGAAGYEEIHRTFGREILAPDGRIDRKKLGSLVFRDEASRRRLNAILHPLILMEARRQVLEFSRRSPGGIAVTQAALLVETGVRKSFDRLVVTHCEPALQVRRLRERDGIPEEEVLNRIRAQAGPAARIAHADYLIDTSGTLDETRAKAREVYRSLRREWESRKASG